MLYYKLKEIKSIDLTKFIIYLLLFLLLNILLCCGIGLLMPFKFISLHFNINISFAFNKLRLWA